APASVEQARWARARLALGARAAARGAQLERARDLLGRPRVPSRPDAGEPARRLPGGCRTRAGRAVRELRRDALVALRAREPRAHAARERAPAPLALRLPLHGLRRALRRRARARRRLARAAAAP